MKKSIWIMYLFCALFIIPILGQNNQVAGTVTTQDTAEIDILNVYPDSFPTVSVVFKAETKSGFPMWNLQEKNMIVEEDKMNCKVISLAPVSKNKTINIGIVIDHSQSMLGDLYYFKTFDSQGNPTFHDNYVPPIDYAKKAVLTFIEGFDLKKDYVSITGFSTSVDVQTPLSQDTSLIKPAIRSMKADSSTALFDAIAVSIEQLKDADGVSVVVVLTDGLDNASRKSVEEVIEKGLEENIPIYTIGLGFANKDKLNWLSKETKGQFFYTKDAGELNRIYATIRNDIQAFYNLVYESPSFDFQDSTRNIQLTFEIADIYTDSAFTSFDLPAKVRAHLAQKEKEKTYLMGGGIATATLIGLGIILLTYRNRQEKKLVLELKRIYPSPSSGRTTFEYSKVINGQLMIYDLQGALVRKESVNAIKKTIDLSAFSNGIYSAMLIANGKKSNVENFIIQQ